MQKLKPQREETFNGEVRRSGIQGLYAFKSSGFKIINSTKPLMDEVTREILLK